MTSKNKSMKKEIDIFSLEFIKKAISIDRKSETEFILITGNQHRVHYKLQINSFEVCINVYIDDLAWIYNCKMEKIHVDAFIWLSRFEFDLRQKDMEDQREFICEWLGL